jgi:site-specific DNA recombinase
MNEKVVLYSRVSTPAQDPRRQDEAILEFCKIKNYEVLASISEVVSGKVEFENRRLNEIFQLPKVDGVIVSELSRLGRNTRDILALLDYLNKKGIWVYSLKENLDTKSSNPTTSLLITMLSAIATLERETTLYRSSQGILSAINMGRWTGGVLLPYGYKKVDKRLVVDEIEADVVKRIFQYYEKGWGSVRIAEKLNSENIPTRYNGAITGEIKYKNKDSKKGKDFKWSDGTIWKILTNPVYIGKKEGRKSLTGVKLQSPSIIEEDLFYKVQEALKSKHKVASKRYVYILDKKIKCGCCGLTYFPHKRENNRDNAYKCLSVRYKNSCGNFGIGIPKLNGGVWTILRKSQNEIENILELSQNRREYFDSIDELSNQVKILKDNLKAAENREKRLIDYYLDGNMEKHIFDERYESEKRKISNLRMDINRIEDDIRSKKTFLENQEGIATSLKEIKEDVNILKDTLGKSISKIVVFPVLENKIEGVFTNKQDALVYVEVYTNINKEKPLSFVISRRSNKMLIVDNQVFYDKENKILKKIDLEEEEEEFGLRVCDIIKIKSVLELSL